MPRSAAARRCETAGQAWEGGCTSVERVTRARGLGRRCGGGRREKSISCIIIEKREPMETFRIRTTVSKDGKLSIKGLPFRPGAKVEVIVREESKKISTAKRKALAGEMQSLFKEIQSLPQARTITEEEITAEITAYRASKSK